MSISQSEEKKEDISLQNEPENENKGSSEIKLNPNKTIKSQNQKAEECVLDENYSDVSFSVSNVDDIDGIYENLSNNSDDKGDFIFEGTGDNLYDQMHNYIEEEYKKGVLKIKPGFDENIKTEAHDFYKKLADSLSDQKNKTGLDKTAAGVTKCTGIDVTGDDQTYKMKNDISGVPVVLQPDITANTNINMDMSDKKNSKNPESSSENTKKELISDEEQMKIDSEKNASAYTSRKKNNNLIDKDKRSRKSNKI